MSSKDEIEQVYSEALEFSRSHYENFPVVSFLFPKELRKHIAIVYQFARVADDIADEGHLSSDERIEHLNEFENNLIQLENNNSISPFWNALQNTIFSKKLTKQNFINLLFAFKQDVVKKRYADFHELLHYCSYSANPVGRIVLELYGIRNEKANFYSDKICTALQLTNFLQDVKEDFAKERIYIPIEDFKKFNLTELSVSMNKSASPFKKLISFEVQRVSNLFDEGEELLKFLPFRLRQQIKWTINGGRGILRKIHEIDFDVLDQRPKFTKFELLKLIF